MDPSYLFSATRALVAWLCKKIRGCWDEEQLPMAWHLGEFVLCEAKIIQIRVIIHAHRDVAGHGKESEHHEVEGQSDSPVFVGEI